VIKGVEIIPLKQIPDERGKIMHMLRKDSPHFKQFGEIYFSAVHPGAVKAWHIHKVMTLNYAVVFGQIKFVLCDKRKESPTCNEIQEIYLGESNYNLVIVPPMVWNGFKGIGDKTAIVANCATHPHDTEEIMRMDPLSPEIPYNWEIKHG
jgi:dTDP-4-dehydrorhamnose 3,5-epimerase